MKNSKTLTICTLLVVYTSLLTLAAFNTPQAISTKQSNVKLDYIYFFNQRVNFTTPSTGKVSNKISFEWRGNNPCNCEKDTVLSITHFEDLVEGNYSIKGSQNLNKNKEVKIRMNFGIYPDTTAAFYVNIYDGDYSISKENGNWVSSLKNGIGYYSVDTFDIIEFKNIEFRATWGND